MPRVWQFPKKLLLFPILLSLQWLSLTVKFAFQMSLLVWVMVVEVEVAVVVSVVI